MPVSAHELALLFPKEHRPRPLPRLCRAAKTATVAQPSTLTASSLAEAALARRGTRPPSLCAHLPCARQIPEGARIASDRLLRVDDEECYQYGVTFTKRLQPLRRPRRRVYGKLDGDWNLACSASSAQNSLQKNVPSVLRQHST
jgi:hypothetical protein